MNKKNYETKNQRRARLCQYIKECPVRWRDPKWVVPSSIEERNRTDEIIIHCTATPEGHDFSVAEIRQMHLAKGWKDIGYHYVILRDGTVCEGRPENLVGAHCQGHNYRSVGVAYVGGVDRLGVHPLDTRTRAQRDAMTRLLRLLLARYPKATIHGHCEFANKACPSFDVKKEYGVNKE
jgi:N-acetylmuramoyl-L-alanine amidase